ncbi:MAG: MetQ/NlpA family ABC transporter substrate-binding protein [Clostridiales bacterium]|nr:MetQ/NlpA family ABC transporter substrate-binding protein [Clostridiales bacterium]
MKKALVYILSIILIISFPACSKSMKKTGSLSIGVLPDVDSIPLIIARQQGYFKEEGVSINIEQFKSAKERDSAFQAGKLDGAVSDVLAEAFAKDGGFDVKITSMTNGSYKLLVNKNAGIGSIRDLKDRSIAISSNTIIEYATDMMVKEGGLAVSDVRKTPIAEIPVRLEMLQNGKIDAATLPDPLATVALKNGAILLGSTDKLNINPGVLIFTSKSIGSKEKEIDAFYRAYNRAVEYLKSQPKSSYMDAIIKESGFPEDVKSTIVLPNYTKASLVSKKDTADVLAWLKDKDLIKNNYGYKDLTDDRFVR